MIEEKDREERMQIVERIVTAIVTANGDKILDQLSFQTISTIDVGPTEESELDAEKPFMVGKDGGRFYTHVRMDGRGQFSIRWPSGLYKTFKFFLKKEWFASFDERQTSYEDTFFSQLDFMPRIVEEDSLSTKLSAAATIRAYELLQGRDFSARQRELYIERYDGKYSNASVAAAFKFLQDCPIEKSRFGARIAGFFGFSDTDNEYRLLVERKARESLEDPEAFERLKARLANDFLKESSQSCESLSALKARSCEGLERVLYRKLEDRARTDEGFRGYLSVVILPLSKFYEYRSDAIDSSKGLYKTWGAFFELGAYLIFRADAFLNEYRPSDREKFCRPLHEAFLTDFCGPLQKDSDQLALIINDRFADYAEFVREGADHELVRETVSRRVHATLLLPNGPSLGSESPHEGVDKCSASQFRFLFARWEKVVIPALNQFFHSFEFVEGSQD